MSYGAQFYHSKKINALRLEWNYLRPMVKLFLHNCVMPKTDLQWAKRFLRETLVLHIMLIIAHFAVGEQPNGNDGKNKQGNNNGKNRHG